MRDFSKVSTTLWDSERFTGLGNDDARLLFVYILTSPHANSAGCYKLSDAYASADLRWTVHRYQEARQALIDSGMIEFDAKHAVVLIAKWFDHNPPMNPSHKNGTRGQLAKVPSEPLREKAEAALKAKCEEIEIGRLAVEAARQKAGWQPSPTGSVQLC